MGNRRVMTTIYLDDKHYKFFKQYTNESMSSVIRKLLDKHIEKSEQK